MRNPISNIAEQIQPSGIRKFFDIVSEMSDAISLGVGEPDLDTPWHIREEGIYSLEKGRTFYTSNAGLKELKEEISEIMGLDIAKVTRRVNMLEIKGYIVKTGHSKYEISERAIK